MTALYRHRDRWGTLLYVGISGNVVVRLDEHSERSRWHGLITRVDVEHFSTREEAKAAELAAIEDERPIYNVRGNSGVRGRKKERRSWAIYQAESHTADGWYAYYDDVVDVYSFYREERPELHFRIVERGTELEEKCRLLLLANRKIYWALISSKFGTQEIATCS